MTRRCVVAVTSCAVAVAVMLLNADHATATSAARQAAAAWMLDAVAHDWYAGQPDADYAAVHDAWRDAGADLSTVDQVVAAHRGDAGADTRAYWFRETACDSPLDLRTQAPRPGDLIGYKLAPGGLAEPWHIGMFVDTSHVVVVNPVKNALDEMPWQEIGPGSGTYRPVSALESTFTACRFRAALLPGGVDAAPAVSGAVSLVDPGRALQDLRWSAAHPRDADQSWTHAAQRAVAALGGAISTPVLGLLELGGGAVRDVLERAGWPGAVLLGIWGAMGTTFDGRVVHRVLTSILVAAVVLLATVTLGPLGTALVGAAVAASLAASWCGVPVAGHIGALIWSVASFATSVLTGVDDSERASFAAVGVALLGDAIIWLRPAGLLARAAGYPLFRGARAVTGAFSHLGDLTMLRPSAGGSSVRALRGAADAAWLRRLRGLPPLLDSNPAVDLDGMAARAAHLAPDAISLIWRPSSLLSDAAAHAADAASWLRDDIIAGGRSWPLSHPAVRNALMSVDAARRQFILDVALPRTVDFGVLSHMHSGARSMTAAASGRHLQTPGSLPDAATPTWSTSLPPR